MQILALECSTSQGSVALLKSAKIIAEKSWEHQHSTSSNGELVVPRIKEILSEVKIDLQDIDLFAVDMGPGRFTGVRVGINTIKSFSYVTKKPILAFSSLEILAQNAESQSHLPIITLINAHKNMVYGATWMKKENVLMQVLGPAVYKISDLEDLVTEPHLCIGDGYLAVAPLISESLSSKLIRDKSIIEEFPKASRLGLLAFSEERERKLLDWKTLFPLYIRASEAEEKLKSGELKPVTRKNLKR